MGLTPGLTSVRRSWLERLLDVVRELGATSDLTEILNRIAQAVVDVLEFGAAAIKVTTSEGDLRVEAVVGPPDLQRLLGIRRPLRQWMDVLEASEEWGSLRFFGHEQDQSIVEHMASWTPPGSAGPDPDAWHPEDSLLAPLLAPDGALLGVLSVDQPASGRRPDLEQRTLLELFATQAATAIAGSKARHASEARRHEAELLWQLAFERSPVGAAIINTDGSLAQVNDAMVAMLGYPRPLLEKMTVSQFTHQDDLTTDAVMYADLIAGVRDGYEIEKRYLHADGHVVWALVHVGVIRDSDGAVQSIVGQVNDITDRKRAVEQLAHRATHDPLTSLPNRSLLEERLSACLASGKPAGVLFFDLDRFKTVNDSLGHEAGDELLAAVARRLREVIPAGFTLGRVGGDEFVALAPDEKDPAALRRLGDRLMAALDEPVLIRGHRHTVSLSVGVTISQPWHQHADEVLREADQAMLRAKRHGRSRVEVYDPTQDKPATVEDLELENALRTAVTEGRGLLPYFQPIIELKNNNTVGYEALIRWQHPTKGLMSPDEFLPLAERTALIVPLGWWMLEVSCHAATQPQFAGDGSRWVAVNASGSQLGRGQLAPAIRHALQACQLPPERLHLEITETALVEASAGAIEEVREVADMGIEIALDDFGTGYSSLTLLRDLPVSTVKIDRSFIAPIAKGRSTATAIVRRVIALCEELGVTTVAEGVETQDQLNALRRLGCTQAQGYLIGQPAPLGLGEAARSLRRRRSTG
jgi:diguanylate cyclase (GGDEF)-like protein/PAS domain S-box-containing protein